MDELKVGDHCRVKQDTFVCKEADGVVVVGITGNVIRVQKITGEEELVPREVLELMPEQKLAAIINALSDLPKETEWLLCVQMDDGPVVVANCNAETLIEFHTASLMAFEKECDE